MENPIYITMESMVPILRNWPTKVSVQWLSEAAKEIGADGIEYFPIKGLVTWQVQHVAPYFLDLFKAGLQSWRSENFQKLMMFYVHHFRPLHPKKVRQCFLATATFRRIAERRESLAILKKLQTTNPNIFLSIFPHHAGTIGGQKWNEEPYPEFRELKHKLLQPEPGLSQDDRWAVKTPEGLRSYAFAYGYDGFCLSRHIASAWPEMEEWHHAIDIFLDDTKLIRVDTSNNIAWFIAEYAISQRCRAPIVIRITPSPFASPQKFINKYKDAVEHFKTSTTHL